MGYVYDVIYTVISNTKTENNPGDTLTMTVAG